MQLLLPLLAPGMIVIPSKAQASCSGFGAVHGAESCCTFGDDLDSLGYPLRFFRHSNMDQLQLAVACLRSLTIA